jgi:hypothetical protein
MNVSGDFQVQLQPADHYATGAVGTQLGRMTFDKTFSGGLSATSQGEMLSAMTPSGSGAYVAIEQVTGTLAGRQGSFVLQHQGSRQNGQDALSVTVVPDSGTGELQGLSGSMTIERLGTEHRYTFDYSLAGAAD